MGCHGAPSRFAVMDLTAEAVLFHVGLVRLGAIGTVRPDRRGGVALVQQAAAQHPAVMATGIRDLPCTDEAVAAINASVALVAEDGDGDVGMLCAVLAQAGLAVDQGPACKIGRASCRERVEMSAVAAPVIERKFI